MKICIVGTGAIGTWLGARLSAAGMSVCAHARGETASALQRNGFVLETPEGVIRGPAHRVSDQTSDLGVQDVLLIALKSPALPQIAPQLLSLCDQNTIVIPAMNGVPWWFCNGLPHFDDPLTSVDPGGALSETLPHNQVLGCVVHASASSPSKGVSRLAGGNRLIVGEPNGGPSARTDTVVAMLSAAGFNAEASDDIRHQIWFKLLGNLTMNPISALTGATLDRLLADPVVRHFCSDAMREAQAVGQAIGCHVTDTPETRHAVTAKLGAFKTSMLQDVEAGRALELDAIVGAVREIAQRLHIPTPNIDAIFGLTRLMARGKGLYA